MGAAGAILGGLKALPPRKILNIKSLNPRCMLLPVINSRSFLLSDEV